jgi:hypothetical protein
MIMLAKAALSVLAVQVHCLRASSLPRRRQIIRAG